MSLRNRLGRLERTKREVTAEADCICFPPEEPSHLELQTEIEAARAVRCPLHGERFKTLAPTVYRAIRLPAHLDRASWIWRSLQYVKAMDASFPPDRWPATKAVGPDGTVRFDLMRCRVCPPLLVCIATRGERLQVGQHRLSVSARHMKTGHWRAKRFTSDPDSSGQQRNHLGIGRRWQAGNAWRYDRPIWFGAR